MFATGYDNGYGYNNVMPYDEQSNQPPKEENVAMTVGLGDEERTVLS